MSRWARWHWRRPKIKHGKLTKWLWMVYYPENLTLGPFTDIGAFTAIFCHKPVEIQEGVQIGSHVTIYTVSTIDGKEGPVFIGRNAKIGSHSLVMPGVHIGERATIGAFSYVRESIPAGATAYGIPCKVRHF